MEKLHSNYFTIKMMPPTTVYGPVDGRKYTLTCLETDGSRVLTIGTKYDMNLGIERNEDILTAEWKTKLGEYILTGNLFISGGECNEELAFKRFILLHQELPEMIYAIIKGDADLYKHVPWLLDAPIYIQGDSHNNQFNMFKYYGTPRSYLNRN